MLTFNYKGTRTTSYQNDVVLVSLLLTLNRFHNFISVFILDFEQENFLLGLCLQFLTVKRLLASLMILVLQTRIVTEEWLFLSQTPVTENFKQ